MSIGKEIGEISVEGDRLVQWTIKDIFSYTLDGAYYNSPRFDVSHTRWYLQVNPNGSKVENSAEYVCLFLFRDDSSAPPVGSSYIFGVKRTDGMVQTFGNECAWIFDEKKDGFGYSRLLLRSTLLNRKKELAPEDALTLTCCLKVYKDFNSSASTEILCQDLLDLFTAKSGCDATLKVKGEEFGVHKCILSARSPVLAAMFEHDMKEKNTSMVDIVDCDPQAFKCFLIYLYSSRAENLSVNAFDVFRIADKYCVKQLKTDCLISIMGNLSLENICDAVSLTDQFSVSELEIKTRNFFIEHFCEIVYTKKWKSLLKSNCHLANELLIDMASKMKTKK